MAPGGSRRGKIRAWFGVYVLSVGLMLASRAGAVSTTLELLGGLSAVAFPVTLALLHEHVKQDVSALLPEESEREVDGNRIGVVLVLSAYLYTALYLLKRRERAADGRVRELTTPVDPESSNPAVDDARRFVRVWMAALRGFGCRCRHWLE
jgi:hypothetical protein